jgi:hypothetical protein
MDASKQPEPYELGPELDAALKASADPRLAATVRDLLRDRAMLMAELSEVKAQLAESKIRLAPPLSDRP